MRAGVDNIIIIILQYNIIITILRYKLRDEKSTYIIIWIART